MSFEDLHNELNKKNELLLKFLESRLGVTVPAKNMEEVYKGIEDRKELFRLEGDVIEIVNKLRIARSFSKIDNPFIEAKSNENKYQKGISNAILEFAEYGWYVNYEFSPIDIAEAYKLCKKNDIEGLDVYMSQKVSNQLDHIKSILIKRHFNRLKPLEAAFRAHDSKEFYLSIPVFFAQADGISKDLSQFQFFLNNRDFSPKVSSWAEANPKIWIHIALCAALKEKGAFQKHHLQSNKIDITRHSVLHGESNDYGTEINSLKAISLVSYISDVMSPREPVLI
jgi:hypothetical protein